MMDYTSIGKNIKKYRLERGLRQEALAEMTNLSSNYIGMLERADKLPSLTALINLSNALEVTSDMLLGDLLNESYKIKNSLILNKIAELSEKEQQRIYAVIDTLLECAEK
jgi:transcriptional regulator with XRE-family HTH domain